MPLVRRLQDRLSAIRDPRRRNEVSGRRVVFERLAAEGKLEAFRGRRILEIGPKHGEDSQLLATLEPSRFVLVDLPQKRSLVDTWLPRVRDRAPNLQYVEGNLLYLDEDLGEFDLVWCLGVLYHNAEQLRLLHRLFTLTAAGGLAVIESATARKRRFANESAVEVYRPGDYRDVPTITQIPSRRALMTLAEMAGFANVRLLDVYSKYLARDRAVILGEHNDRSSPYLIHGSWVAGEAT
jgi:SAM-dependent methyltransferase